MPTNTLYLYLSKDTLSTNRNECEVGVWWEDGSRCQDTKYFTFHHIYHLVLYYMTALYIFICLRSEILRLNNFSAVWFTIGNVEPEQCSFVKLWRTFLYTILLWLLSDTSALLNTNLLFLLYIGWNWTSFIYAETTWSSNRKCKREYFRYFKLKYKTRIYQSNV